MNDRNINAPISKIVEAIMKALDNRIGSYIYPFQIEEAIASLGGEEVNYSDVKLNLERMVGSVHELSDNSDEVIEDGRPYQIRTSNLYNALEPFAKELASHPSEREVLEDYHNWLNENPTASFMSDMKPSDRYLAEKKSKTKTEKK